MHIQTHDLMGIPGPDMLQELDKAAPECPPSKPRNRNKSPPPRPLTLLVAPHSATFLDPYTAGATGGNRASQPQLQLHHLWTYSRHLNLDDLDFGDDGVWATLRRVVGRRGLRVWSVKRKECED
jgi:phosphatidylinositol glycan class Z